MFEKTRCVKNLENRNILYKHSEIKTSFKNDEEDGNSRARISPNIGSPRVRSKSR